MTIVYNSADYLFYVIGVSSINMYSIVYRFMFDWLLCHVENTDILLIKNYLRWREFLMTIVLTELCSSNTMGVYLTVSRFFFYLFRI
jgi:hypothetical protein